MRAGIVASAEVERLAGEPQPVVVLIIDAGAAGRVEKADTNRQRLQVPPRLRRHSEAALESCFIDDHSLTATGCRIGDRELVRFVHPLATRIVRELDVVETIPLRIGNEAQHDRGARVPADRISDLALAHAPARLVLRFHPEIQRNAIGATESGS